MYRPTKSPKDWDLFKPLIPVGEFMDLYNRIKLYITSRFGLNTITQRSNRFLKRHIKKQLQMDMNITSHFLRKIYATICAERMQGVNKRVAIKECLNHASMKSVENYATYVINKEVWDGDRCKPCGVTIKGKRKHEKTKKHIDNLAAWKQL